MTTLAHLAAAAKERLAQRLASLGFAKGAREGVHVLRLGEDALLYLFCRPFRREGRVFLDPIIALENETLRGLIGEDEPRQREPRFANLYLSHTVNRHTTLWEFVDEPGMEAALQEIENALTGGGIPFARKHMGLRAAMTLLKQGIEGREAPGVVTHPTRKTRALLEHFQAD